MCSLRGHDSKPPRTTTISLARSVLSLPGTSSRVVLRLLVQQTLALMHCRTCFSGGHINTIVSGPLSSPPSLRHFLPISIIHSFIVHLSLLFFFIFLFTSPGMVFIFTAFLVAYIFLSLVMCETSFSHVFFPPHLNHKSPCV